METVRSSLAEFKAMNKRQAASQAINLGAHRPDARDALFGPIRGQCHREVAGSSDPPTANRTASGGPRVAPLAPRTFPADHRSLRPAQG